MRVLVHIRRGGNVVQLRPPRADMRACILLLVRKQDVLHPNICTSLTPDWFMLTVVRLGAVDFIRGESMDTKLALLFMLIGTVIGLSHLTDGNLDRMRRQFGTLRRRGAKLGWRRG